MDIYNVTMFILLLPRLQKLELGIGCICTRSGDRLIRALRKTRLSILILNLLTGHNTSWHTKAIVLACPSLRSLTVDYQLSGVRARLGANTVRCILHALPHLTLLHLKMKSRA